DPRGAISMRRRPASNSTSASSAPDRVGRVALRRAPSQGRSPWRAAAPTDDQTFLTRRQTCPRGLILREADLELLKGTYQTLCSGRSTFTSVTHVKSPSKILFTPDWKSSG